jgi:hypothetical protein
MHPLRAGRRPSALAGLRPDEVDALATAFLGQQRGRGDDAHSDQRGADDEPGAQAGRACERDAVPGGGGARDSDRAALIRANVALAVVKAATLAALRLGGGQLAPGDRAEILAAALRVPEH